MDEKLVIKLDKFTPYEITTQNLFNTTKKLCTGGFKDFTDFDFTKSYTMPVQNTLQAAILIIFKRFEDEPDPNTSDVLKSLSDNSLHNSIDPQQDIINEVESVANILAKI